MCPLLFGLIGTLMNFETLPDGTIPKAVAIIFAGDYNLLSPKVETAEDVLALIHAFVTHCLRALMRKPCNPALCHLAFLAVDSHL